MNISFRLKNLRVIAVIFILLSAGIDLNAQSSDPLNKKISVEFDSAELTEALEIITDKADVNFIFDPDAIKGIIVTGEFENVSVNIILSTILSEHAVNYVLDNDGRIRISKQSFKGLKNSIISGRVIVKGSKEPLINANVYLNKTTIGTATDNDGLYAINNVPNGRYMLIASYTGYKPVFKPMEITSSDFFQIEFELEENMEIQSEITVTAEDPKARKRNFDRFEKAFIGDSKNAKKTEIINIDALSFDLDRKTNTLTAKASEPLIIENNALGYKMRFSLLDFKMVEKNVEYKGYSFFEKMSSEDKEAEKKWVENREKTYIGSFPHFLKSLIKGEVEKFRFELHYGDVIVTYRNAPRHLKDYDTIIFDRKVHPERYTSTRQLFKPYNEYERLWSGGEDQGEYILKFDELLDVSYRNDKNRSVLKLNNGYAYFNSNGQLRDPYSVTVTGEWANRKLADLLPFEYNPEADALAIVENIDEEELAEKYSVLEDFVGDEELISKVLEFWLERYRKISKEGKADPLTGIEFIELTTKYKIKELYDVASQLYFWGFSKGFNEGNTEVISEEMERILPLLEESEKAEWNELIESEDNELFVRFREFWKKNDPIPVSVQNERLLEHWERINYAKNLYTKNKNTVYGADERGLIYVRYGSPDKLAKDRFGVNIDYMDQYRRYIVDVKNHKYNYDPDFELWIYTDLLNKDTVRYFFGPEYGNGEFGLRSGVEEFIDPAAFHESGTLLSAPITVGTILQYMYYKQLEKVDDMYYYRNLELSGGRAITASPSVNQSTIMSGISSATSSVTTKDIVLHGSDKSISRFVYAAYDRDDPAKQKAAKELSDYGDILSDLDTRMFLYRMLGPDNDPRLELAVYNLPRGHTDDNTDLIYDLSGGNEYNLINTVIITDDQWSEVERIIDVPSSRKSNFSGFIFAHRPKPGNYELASVASEVFMYDSLTGKTENDTLFGTIAGFKTFLELAAPLETDPDSLVISDLLIGKEIAAQTDDDFFKVYPGEVFTAGQNLMIYFELYHLYLGSSGKGNYTVKYRIESEEKGNILSRITGRRNNENISAQEFTFESLSRTSGELLELEISALEPGEYTLTIEALDNISKQKRKRSIKFKLLKSEQNK
ncbi:carboxypeptidase-like regulatory domain-containing protein [candidate division KSB1 bacterium]